MTTPLSISLSKDAPMSEYQRYIHQLEALHGWLDCRFDQQLLSDG